MTNICNKPDIGVTALKNSALQCGDKTETPNELQENRSKDFFLKEKIKESRKFFLKLAEAFITPN